MCPGLKTANPSLLKSDNVIGSIAPVRQSTQIYVRKPTGGLKAFILKVPDFISCLDMYAIPLGTGLALMGDGRENR